MASSLSVTILEIFCSIGTGSIQFPRAVILTGDCFQMLTPMHFLVKMAILQGINEMAAKCMIFLP